MHTVRTPHSQVDGTRGRSSMDGSSNNGELSAAADNKQSAFQIAVSVAHAADNKVKTHSHIYLFQVHVVVAFFCFVFFSYFMSSNN